MTTGLNDLTPPGFSRDMAHGSHIFFNGLHIVATEMAVDVKVEYRVSRCGPYDRKRKRYYVERVETRKPGCWKAGDVLYMHPTRVERLKQGDKP